MELFNPVTLYVDNSMPREVSSFKMSITQRVDETGQVTALPVGGRIVMTLKATNIGLTGLVRWAASKDQRESGTITFQNTTTGIIMKTIRFIDAYCVGYTEDWKDSTSNTSLAHTEEITLSCRVIQIDMQPLHTNYWDLTKGEEEEDKDNAAKLATAISGAAAVGGASATAVTTYGKGVGTLANEGEKD